MESGWWVVAGPALAAFCCLWVTVAIALAAAWVRNKGRTDQAPK